MRVRTTPGHVRLVRCGFCGRNIHFNVAGGSHKIHRTGCRKTVALEAVYDGSKWKVKRPE